MFHKTKYKYCWPQITQNVSPIIESSRCFNQSSINHQWAWFLQSWRLIRNVVTHSHKALEDVERLETDLSTLTNPPGALNASLRDFFTLTQISGGPEGTEKSIYTLINFLELHRSEWETLTPFPSPLNLYRTCSDTNPLSKLSASWEGVVKTIYPLENPFGDSDNTNKFFSLPEGQHWTPEFEVTSDGASKENATQGIYAGQILALADMAYQYIGVQFSNDYHPPPPQIPAPGESFLEVAQMPVSQAAGAQGIIIRQILALIDPVDELLGMQVP